MRGEFLRIFWQLERQQWWAAAELAELQNRRLRALVAHAYERVPYYRRLFHESGLRPEEVSTVEDLRKIPLLTKQTLQRASLTDFLAQGIDPKRCVIKTTSGSTGRPLTHYRTRREDQYGSFTWFRAYTSNGRRPWHSQVNIVDRSHVPKRSSSIGSTMRKLLGCPRLYIASDQPVDEQIQLLQSHRPQVLYSYNQSLRLLAQALRSSGSRDLSPRFVFGSAELLDGPCRALINEVFGLKMVDIYASIEADVIAWECPQHSGYHINADTAVVELVREGQAVRSGEPGRVVVTPLYAYAMPLIRYDQGDVATATDIPCRCGRGLPLMEMIQGRKDDFVTLRSGRIVPPVGTFADVMERESAVLEYLVLQEDYDLVVVKLVLRNGKAADVVERVGRGIEELLQHEAHVVVEVVEEIDRAGQSKLRRIVSRVPVNF